MSSPRRAILALGAVHVAAALAHSLSSLALNLVKPLSAVEGRLPYFRRLAAESPLLPDSLRERLLGLAPDPGAFLLAFGLPLLVSTATFAALALTLVRARSRLDADCPRLLFVVAVASALASVPALPVLADDFWLSVAWGRMLAAGGDPYTAALSAGMTVGTPLEFAPWGGRMTYGPLWAAVCQGVMGLAGGRAIAGALLFKLLLCVGWIACVWCVWRLLRGERLVRQCLGIAICGWLPVGAGQVVAEGHNDVFVALPILLWLLALARARPLAGSLALAASVAVKYVSAPLFAVDLVHDLFERRRGPARALLRLGAAAGAFLAVVAAFHDVPGFFRHVFGLAEWRYHFFTLTEAVAALEDGVGLSLGPTRHAVRLVFPAIAVALLVAYARRPGETARNAAALGVVCGVLFGVASYVWPWYLVWVLGLAALQPGSRLAHWVMAVAVLAPFPVLVENAYPRWPHWWSYVLPSLLWYGSALAIALLLPRLARAAREPGAG